MKLIPGKYYHIYNRGNNRQRIFFENENYQFFLDRFKKYLGSYVDVYAYSLLPNHFHFFIKVSENNEDDSQDTKSLTPVEKAFKDFFISYSKAINKRYDRSGSLFQYKFKRKEVECDQYFTWLVFYIHANAIKAELATEFESWRYHSYNAIISDKETLVKRDEVITWFGNKEAFVRFHQLNIKDSQCLDSKKFKEILF